MSGRKVSLRAQLSIHSLMPPNVDPIPAKDIMMYEYILEEMMSQPKYLPENVKSRKNTCVTIGLEIKYHWCRYELGFYYGKVTIVASQDRLCG